MACIRLLHQARFPRFRELGISAGGWGLCARRQLTKLEGFALLGATCLRRAARQAPTFVVGISRLDQLGDLLLADGAVRLLMELVRLLGLVGEEVGGDDLATAVLHERTPIDQLPL